MKLLEKIKHYEYLHIVFWLIKDSCWMLELKIPGIVMIIPTIVLAAMIVYHTWRTIDVFINTAILFWISANSYWMLVEFLGHIELKIYAAIPFALGFVFVGIFYYNRWKEKDIVDPSTEN